MDKISVIIPVYNSSSYLYDCLTSIFNSTYRNIEVIVVDDGSTDDIQSTIEEFSSRIIFLPTVNIGQAAARNLGFSKSTGKYAAFVDADDINGKMWFELCIKRFEKKPRTGMIFCGTTFINDEGKFLTGVSKFPNFTSETFLGRMFEQNLITTLSSTIVISRLFKKVGGFDETFPLAEDYDLYLRLGKVTRIEYIDLPLVRKRRHKENLRLDWQKYKEYETKAIQKHEPTEIASELSRVYRNEEDFRIAFGRVLYRTGKVRQALQHFKKAQEINTHNSDAYFHSGNCYFDIGNYRKADKEYSKCLAINPRHAGCLNNVGVLYFRIGEYKRSVAELKKAQRYGDNFFEPHYNLACIKGESCQPKLRLSIPGRAHLQSELDLRLAQGDR